MKYLMLILLTSCGTDITELSPEQGDNNEATAATDIQPRVYDTGAARALGFDVGTGPTGPEAGAISPQSLCLFPDSGNAELFLGVRASAGRFAERLGIPVALCNDGVPVIVQKEVILNGKSYSALAHYDRLCRFAECNTLAQIYVSEASVTTQLEWLPNMLDHEIGHILSSWGTVLGVDQHLPPGHIMSVVNKRENRWTQADIDLWCSASPCSKTTWQEETSDEPNGTSDVDSDAGTSSLSNDSGMSDATGGNAPEDGGL